MNAKQLFEQGKIREAQQALSEWLRGHPEDIPERTFLFELLCFSGEWERASRQLAVLAASGGQRELGAILYFSALAAERSRHEMFADRAWPGTTPTEQLCGTVNGRPFQLISDADPAIGAHLEIFAAGAYLWLAFEHIASIRMEAPRKLRDTLWVPATVQTLPSFHGGELGEVLIPAIYPFSWKQPQETVWLGRESRWIEEGGREHPVGQKMLLLDEEEVPLLEIRELHFKAAGVVGHA